MKKVFVVLVLFGFMFLTVASSSSSEALASCECTSSGACSGTCESGLGENRQCRPFKDGGCWCPDLNDPSDVADIATSCTGDSNPYPSHTPEYGCECNSDGTCSGTCESGPGENRQRRPFKDGGCWCPDLNDPSDVADIATSCVDGVVPTSPGEADSGADADSDTGDIGLEILPSTNPSQRSAEGSNSDPISTDTPEYGCECNSDGTCSGKCESGLGENRQCRPFKDGGCWCPDLNDPSDVADIATSCTGDSNPYPSHTPEYGCECNSDGTCSGTCESGPGENRQCRPFKDGGCWCPDLNDPSDVADIGTSCSDYSIPGIPN